MFDMTWGTALMDVDKRCGKPVNNDHLETLNALFPKPRGEVDEYFRKASRSNAYKNNKKKSKKKSKKGRSGGSGLKKGFLL